MKPLAVARRYARALADVAGEKDSAGLEKIAVELLLVAEVMHAEPALLRFFDDPSVPQEKKDGLLATLGRKAKIGERTGRFLRLLVARRRLGAIGTIARAFEAIKDERLGIVPVEATTAIALKGADLKRFSDSLEKMTGRSVRLKMKVDAGVLGGARTRIGAKIYDGTLRRRLAMLRERLAPAR
ncbi:MAG: ATP synthase F1 subunit delta [Acidobacteria bacterium]|nr:MAG: ATP synthase F1 subunit delta [Acidobacteriota bacterium]